MRQIGEAAVRVLVAVSLAAAPLPGLAEPPALPMPVAPLARDGGPTPPLTGPWMADQTLSTEDRAIEDRAAKDPGAVDLATGDQDQREQSAVFAERIQVLYDTVTGSASRQLVRVRDFAPGLGLDFTWEPAAGNSPGLDEDGRASGQGVLVWRIPGTAAYDPRALHSRFEGEFHQGAPEGPGRQHLRDGQWRDGIWRAGVQEGPGRWQQADGALYQGNFSAGQPSGMGVLRAAAGWIYQGPFQDGLPHGQGEMRRPGGPAYGVTMEHGVETASDRPALHGDSTLGGLLPVQGGGGEAERVEISVVTNARVSLQQDVSYIHYNDGVAIHLTPKSQFGPEQELIEAWTGNGTMDLPGAFYDYTAEDWLETRAFLDITLATRDQSRVRLEALDLVVDQSAPHLKPILTTRPAGVCIGHRPWFDFLNRGWGPVEEPRLQVSFGRLNSLDSFDVTPVSDWVDVPVTGFDAGRSVDMRPVLASLGLDTATLAGNRFTCPSAAEIESCAQNLIASVDLGQLEGLVVSSHAVDYDRTIVLPMHGQLSYVWTDAWGNRTPETESFSVRLVLAQIEVGGSFAEMGAGGAFTTPAPDFQDIPLPVSSPGARINLPLRGNPNITSVTAHVQLHAERSSVHSLHVEARMGDGSVRSSMPMYLYYFLPRSPQFLTEIRPEACFLAMDY